MTTLPDLVLPETIDAVDQPHPDFGGWQNFIRNHTELRDEHDGVRFFGATNCNYILFPSGLLIQNFGFNGRALMNAVREKGINTVETELRASRLELKTAVANLFARERQAARDLCDWLRTCPYHSTGEKVTGSPHIESAVPVRVHFGPKDRRHKVQQSWFGALYCEKHECAPKERVVDEGPMKAGEITRSYRLYLLGRLFQHSQRGEKWVAVYDLPDDRRHPLERCYGPSNEWYLSFYWQDEKNTLPQQRLYSPFGRMFGLVLHQSMNFGYYKDWKIDTGERKPYARLPMTVEYL